MSKQNDLPNIYTIAETGEYLGVSSDTVEREIKRNKLGFVKIGGRKKILLEQILRYLESHRSDPCQASKKNSDKLENTGSQNKVEARSGVELGSTKRPDKRDVHHLARQTLKTLSSNCTNGS